MLIKSNFLKFLLLTILVIGCDGTKEEKEIHTAPIEFTKDAEAFLINSEGDTLQNLDIEIADDDFERETGLMYRKEMGENQGMLFIFPEEAPRGFYMKNTYIPLDLIFLNSEQKIVSISEDAKPGSTETILSEVPAQFVLEVNSGLSHKWNLQKGDSLILNQK